MFHLGGRNAKVNARCADWAAIIGRDPALWQVARRYAATGPKVLMATSVGGQLTAMTIESLLAAALTLRGADVHVLLCDATLRACSQCRVAWYPKLPYFLRNGPQRDLCHGCFHPGTRTFHPLGLRVHRYSDFLTTEEQAVADRVAASLPINDIATYQLAGLRLGDQALAGALRFFARATLDQQPYAEAVLRRYLHAAIITAFAVRRLLATSQFRTAVCHQGVYVPEGVIGEVCRQQGVPLVNWGATYRKKCVIFSHDDTYHHTLMNEPTDIWERMPWTPAMEAQILNYLRSRRHGTYDWIQVHPNANTDLHWIRRELGVDFSTPCVGLLTNVMWDAQIHYPANAFPNMRDWVLATIRYFAGRPDLQLLIRVHPAELARGTQMRSRQQIVQEIAEAFPHLPGNIKVIPPESEISTYAVMEQCNAVLVYATKAGVELAALGIPVIVAGEAWSRNKGFTLDADSEQGYLALLDRLPFHDRLDSATTQRARKYAYHFFFRRMIPLDLVRGSSNGPTTVCAERLPELLPGRDLGLDVICNGILQRAPFVFPAETLEGTGSLPAPWPGGDPAESIGIR